MDARLTDILCFTRESHDRAARCSGDLLAGFSPQGTSDARELFAAACLAFDEDPDRYASAQAGRPPNQRIFDKIKSDVGTRSLPTGQGALEAKQMLSIDAAAGSLLAGRFRKGSGVA